MHRDSDRRNNMQHGLLARALDIAHREAAARDKINTINARLTYSFRVHSLAHHPRDTFPAPLCLPPPQRTSDFLIGSRARIQ